MMSDVCYYLELNNEEYLCEKYSKFKIVSSPKTAGSLLTNLIIAKDAYSDLINQEETSKFDKMNYFSRMEAINFVLELTSPYLKANFANKNLNFKFVLESIAKYISIFRNDAKHKLKENDRNGALKSLFKSYEIYHVLDLVDSYYLKNGIERKGVNV